jgi:hypothetical protein
MIDVCRGTNLWITSCAQGERLFWRHDKIACVNRVLFARILGTGRRNGKHSKHRTDRSIPAIKTRSRNLLGETQRADFQQAILIRQSSHEYNPFLFGKVSRAALLAVLSESR